MYYYYYYYYYYDDDDDDELTMFDDDELQSFDKRSLLTLLDSGRTSQCHAQHVCVSSTEL